MTPKTYQILTNLDCNLRCKYCYEHDKPSGFNNLDHVKDYIRSSIESNTDESTTKFAFEFIGGESFLYPKELTELFEYTLDQCKRCGIQEPPLFILSTNGTLLNEKSVQQLVSTYGRYMSVGFSIDGTKEIHDTNRVDIHGNGTYDRAVAGYMWAKQHICNYKTSAKATFTHETIDRYYESIINLLNLGFVEIAANGVFEEVWTQEDAILIKDQMYRIVDYLFEHKLEDKVRILQINPEGTDTNTMAIGIRKEGNFCGTCKHIRCLGLDNKIYGCHRFATMNKPQYTLGELKDGEIIIHNQELIDEVISQYTHWPVACKECNLGQMCASCCAAPYESDVVDVDAYCGRKAQCGFTIARAAAMCYYCYRMQNRTTQTPFI